MRWDDSSSPNVSRLRGGHLTRLSDALPRALDRSAPKGLWTEARLRKAWRQAVGADVADHAQVHRLRGTTLEVRVDADSWATELTYLSQVVLQKLNEVCGPGTVTELTVRRSRRR
ncbi:MAG TPA: DUF721 domain-containing protein [Actinomycetota bacterium]|nr:DUF721 domain-containing protein [Actinomycetota bacterium]